MPPKKGKGKGKGKKSGKKSGNELKPPEPPLTASRKEYYLVQIRDLEQRLTRYQRKCDQLEILNEDIEEKYNQLLQDRKDIVEFLKKSLEERQEDIASLQDRLVGQQQVKEAEKEEFEDKMGHLKDDYQALLDQMTSENTILKGKLDSLEEFRIQKEDLMASFAQLKTAFEQLEKDHEDTVYNLEHKAVVDKDRMKKDMLLHLNTLAEEFRNVSDQKTAYTVKRNIRENVAINQQLAKMTITVKDLLQQNDEYKKRQKENKIQIDILEATQDKLAKKNKGLIKLLTLLADKMQEQRARLLELESREREYEQVEDHSEDMRRENEAMRHQVKSLKDELKATKDLLQKMKTENEELYAGSERLEEILSSAAYALKEVLTERPDDDEVERTRKRTGMIEKLLIVMDSAVILGRAPPPTEFLDQRPKAIMAPLAALPRRRKQDVSIMDRFREFPHYNLGDLGLIPRPRQKMDRREATLSSSPNYFSRFPPSSSRAFSTAMSESPPSKPDKLPPISQTGDV